MNKFTIFSIILAISVITITVDLAVRDYFGEESMASVLRTSADREEAKVEPAEEARDMPEQRGASASGGAAQISEAPKPASDSVPESPSPPPPYIPPPPSSTVTQNLITQSGFNDKLVENHFNGKVFQLLDITKIPVAAMGFYEIHHNGGPVASVTEIALQDEIRALQMYILLQNKTKPYIDLSLNETNAYGDRSFYINHAKKPDEAFLTVKIGKMIYAFAYGKVFHPEIKKLIQLLSP